MSHSNLVGWHPLKSLFLHSGNYCWSNSLRISQKNSLNVATMHRNCLYLIPWTSKLLVTEEILCMLALLCFCWVPFLGPYWRQSSGLEVWPRAATPLKKYCSLFSFFYPRVCSLIGLLLCRSYKKMCCLIDMLKC